MYTPARSDLVALALAAVATGLLLAFLNWTSSTWLGLTAFVAISLVPILAAGLAAPRHTGRSRLIFRGVAAIAGMAAATMASVLFWDADMTRQDLGLQAAGLTAIFALTSTVLLLITSTLTRPRPA